MMFYFRDEEFQQLDRFFSHDGSKAMAIYGRRRAGKTRLLSEYMQKKSGQILYLYFQCSSYDYSSCLSDFISSAKMLFPAETFLSEAASFKDVISLLTRLHSENLCIIIDEFPFLAKRNENVPVEFQWIIDHGLHGKKIILTGSNRSFMTKQIQSDESPLYGRFDEIMEVRPFSFQQILTLFSSFDDAMKVYAMTGGVAQYVNFFLNYSSVREAISFLFFTPDGRLLREAPNLLLQELRDTTTYERILRGLGASDKNSGQIAKQSRIESKGIFPYLNRLHELQLVTPVDNPLSTEKRNQRFRINDALFRFHYTFIEPNMSMINSLQTKSVDYILGNQFSEFVGITYEDIIRESCFQYALDGRIPFMPRTLGKWWGPVFKENVWQESEVDLVAFDDHHLLIGECKCRSKAVGIKELDELKLKAAFIPSGRRDLFYLLASKSGFTEELLSLQDPRIILINQV